MEKIFLYAERNHRANMHPVVCPGKPNTETPSSFIPAWLLETFALWSYPGRRHIPQGWRQEEGCTQWALKGWHPPPRLPREGTATMARMGGNTPPSTSLAWVGHHAEKLPTTVAEQQLPPSPQRWPWSSPRSSTLGMHMGNRWWTNALRSNHIQAQVDNRVFPTSILYLFRFVF